MPELPEVETTRRGIEPHVVGRTITRVLVRNAKLRWRVTNTLVRELSGQSIQSVGRRAKYLLLATAKGTAIVHLGMSGSLRIVPCTQSPKLHDHVDLVLDDGQCLRLHDPRRFGALLWTREPAGQHKLLRHLGPEPLAPEFDGEHLYTVSRHRSRGIRDFLLDGRIIAGLGNIYANEALFLAGLRPSRAAGRINRAQYQALAKAIQDTLMRALHAGGTTLRDFLNGRGEPGYFQQSLSVYGRTGQPCHRCQTPIRAKRLGQRNSFFCPNCQI